MIKNISVTNVSSSSLTCKSRAVGLAEFKHKLETIEDYFNLNTNYGWYKNISKEVLETAGPMFSYLRFCPGSQILEDYKLPKGLILNQFPKSLLLNLNILLVQDWNPIAMKHIIFGMVKRFNLKFMKIRKYIGHSDNSPSNETGMENEDKIQTVINHPVHLYGINENRSPSALIPYCWFGKALDINLAVEASNCRAFKSILRNDQVCYEFDPSMNMSIASKKEKSDQLKHGLHLVIDENKDRQ